MDPSLGPRPRFTRLRAIFTGSLNKVRLHRYIRLQGQLSRNTEACNQTSLKKKPCSEVSTAERNMCSKYDRKCVGSP
eukprot:1138569-Pelagomonas_calceolata.AAC.7